MTRARRVLSLSLFALLLVVVAVRGQAPQPPGEPATASEAPPQTPEELFQADIHAEAGLTCESCHTEASGGGQAVAIVRTEIPQVCARCHADGEYMTARLEDPDAPAPPVDQYELYQQSRHGERLAEGETRVATCSDCHRAHGVVKVSNPESPVAVLRIADTCARCHGDSDLMEEFDHYENAPEDWKTSEHAKALLEGGDLSAPTCPTCHGSHNATRPESLEDLLGACANCHVREADLYQKSSHKVALDDVEESGCITCHSNHAVEEPTEAMLGLEEGSVCYDCHNEQMAGVEMIRQSKVRLVELADSIEQAEQALDRAHVAGMLVDEGMLILGRAREQQILSKVAMHGFELDPIVERVDAGLALSAEAEQYGDDAMVELQYRRKGLAVATLLILGFLITLGVKIRRLPSFPD